MDTIFTKMDVEACCLQIRKILELLAMGSLVVNERLFRETSRNINSMHKAKYILNEIQELNPRFFPRPISPELDESDTIVDITENVLTKKLFEKIFDKCGAMLHSPNPFGKTIDYKFYCNQIPLWLDLILNTIATHMVLFPGHEDGFIIHMNNPQKQISWTVIKSEEGYNREQADQ